MPDKNIGEGTALTNGDTLLRICVMQAAVDEYRQVHRRSR